MLSFFYFCLTITYHFLLFLRDLTTSERFSFYGSQMNQQGELPTKLPTLFQSFLVSL